MTTTSKTISAIVATLGVPLVSATSIGARRQQRALVATRDRLTTAGQDAGTRVEARSPEPQRDDQVAPFVHVRVLDALVEGRGPGQVSLMSAFPVMFDADTPEMNEGSLHRYLAKAVWYPTALLPGPHLRWTAIDANTALATLTGKGVTVSLECRVANSGEVTGIYTPARWGKFPEGYRQWRGKATSVTTLSAMV
jgi:hypothetical protein